jgi:predicted transcriptional regulator
MDEHEFVTTFLCNELAILNYFTDNNSTRTLSKRTGFSQFTISKAMEQLANRGLLVKKGRSHRLTEKGILMSKKLQRVLLGIY